MRPTAGGTLTFNPDGTYDYIPANDYVGDDTFVYQICDGGNPIACDTANVTITVVDDPIIGNDPPVAINDVNITEVGIPVDGNVLVNDFDPDLGDTITVTANTDPTNGTLVIAPNGDYTYTPDPLFEGIDTFEYTICDDATPSLCDTAIVTIYVIGDPGNITIANDDAYYGEINTVISGNVLDNDSDPETDSQEVNIVVTPISGPSNGTILINSDGSFEYTPTIGFTGNDQFVYEIFDDGSPVATDQATVYILVEQTPAPAIAIVKAGVFVDGNGDQCADEGESIDYTFTVTNEGNVSLGNITVTDPLLEAPNPVVAIAFAGGDTNGDGLLDIDETWTYTASYTITQDDIDLGTITNQATVEGTDNDGTTVDDVSDESDVLGNDPTVTDVCQSPVIAIVKAGVLNDNNQSGCSDAGIDTISYTFTVTNEGNVSLTNVTVTDPLLEAPNPVVPIVFVSGDTDGDGELDIDETWEYTADYTLTQGDIDAGGVTNQATATGTGAGTTVDDVSDESDVLGNDPTVTDVCQSPVIAIVKAGVLNDNNQSGCSDAGIDTISYTFTVTNEGNVSLTNVTVTDPLLEAPNPVVPIVFVSGDTDADGELDIDETWEYTADYTLTQGDIDAGGVTNQATATGTGAGTTVDDVSDESDVLGNDPTVTDVCQSPVIAIVKAGVLNDNNQSGCSDAGIDTISYTFTVTNEGNVSLTNVTVTDPLLEAPNPVVPIVFVSGDTDGDGELDIDETWEYTADYTLTQGDIDAGGVTNQATATGTGAGTTVDDVSDESDVLGNDPTVTDVCQSPVIAIVKAGVLNDNNQSGCSDAGIDTISYTFTVTNEGNVSLTNVTVTDPLLEAPNPVVPIVFVSGDTDGDGELDIDETWEYTADYTLTQGDIDAGGVTNQATATGTGAGTTVDDVSDESDVLGNDPTVTDVCQSPVIAIVKAGVLNDNNQSGCSDAGIDTISYTFTVTNEGNVSLTNVTVTDPLLEAPNPVVPIVFVSGDTDGDGELDIDETWEYTADYTLTQGDIDAGGVTNQATATGTGAGTTVDDVSDESDVLGNDPTVTDVCQSPVIAIVKAGVLNDNNQSGCSDAGIDTISYTFTVTNEGNVSLTNVTVTDPLLEAPNPVVPIVFVSGDTDGDGELDIDETWEYTADYTLTQGDIDAGGVTNQATATGTGAGTTVDDVSDESDVLGNDPTVTDVCQSPVIAIVKAGVLNDNNQSGCSDAGIDTISYTFTVTNEGNVSLTNVTVTDPLLEAPNPVVPIVFVSGDTDGDGELDIDETWEYTADYTLTQGDIDAGGVTNQATATGTGAGTTVDDVSDESDVLGNDPTVTDVCQSPVIAIVKAGVLNDNNQSGCSDAGIDTISYTFTVTNEGNVSLTNVTVTDPLLEAPNPVVPIVFVSGDTDGDGELDIDETWEYTADYTLTQGDIDAGGVTNQATATGTGAGTTVDDVSDESDVLGNDPTVTDVCQSPVIAIVKAGVLNDNNQSGCSDAGIDTISYTFTVTNEGNVSLTNVTVTDPLLEAPNPVVPIVFVSGDTDGDGELDIDETWEYTADYTLTQGDIDAGGVTNQATATGTGAGTTVDDVSDESDVLGNDPTVTDVCQSPVIAIVKAGVLNDNNQSGCSDAGIDTISYTFTVTNEGNVSLTNVTVTDPLLEAPNPVVPIVFVSGDTDADGELDIDETWEYTADYTLTQGDIDAGGVTNQATATGTGAGTTVDDVSDESDVLGNDPTVTDVCQSPVIAIVKAGVLNDNNQSGCSDAGIDTISYTFTVTNEGNVSLTNVTVTDPLLEAPNPVVPIVFVSGDTDADGELDIDETWEYTADYTLTQGDIDAGGVTNQATATGTGAGTTVDDVSDESDVLGNDPTVTDVCQSPSIALIKRGTLNDENGNGCTDVDETISYEFEVMNTGNVTLTAVDIDDLLVNVVGGPIVLAPGQTDATTFTAVYSINQVDIDNGSFTNQATAMGTAPDGTVVEDDSDFDTFVDDNPTVTILCQNASIALIKVGTVMDENGSGCADPKETIDYAFTVMNTGNVTITNIDIDDPLVNVQGGPITLAPGQTDLNSFTATYLITQANINDGFVENQATVSGLDPQSNTVSDDSDDNSFLEDDPTITPLCQDSIIALIKTGTLVDANSNGCVDLGETIVYDFVVTNLGNVELTNVMVTDPMVAVIGGPITLPAGESDTETFFAEYIVTQEDVDNGSVVNQATVVGTTPEGIMVSDLSDNNSNFENDPTVSTLCQDPRVSLEKEGIFNDDNGDGRPQPGETISYVFSVRNTGNITLYNLTLEDTDLEGLVITGDPIPVLLAGEFDETTYSATYAISQEDIDNGEVINQAIIRGTTQDGIEVEDTSDDPNDLTNVDPDGDGDPDDPTVVILPNVLPELPFEIFNGITPDADGLNDFFRVLGIENFPDNNMKIYNRWGVLVWETDGYGGATGQDNVFDGFSNARATIQDNKLLPTGTYFYILVRQDPNSGETLKNNGYLYINR